MNIINIEHISKLFGDKLIFDDASFGCRKATRLVSSESTEPENPRCCAW